MYEEQFTDQEMQYRKRFEEKLKLVKSLQTDLEDLKGIFESNKKIIEELDDSIKSCRDTYFYLTRGFDEYRMYLFKEYQNHKKM